MPIPGPSSPALAPAAAATGSPFWLRLQGTWVHLEGVNVGVAITNDRSGSEMRSSNGNRYLQRSPLRRRQWDVTFTHAAAAATAVAVLQAAAELTDVMLASDHALTTNMLRRRACFGSDAETVDCGGVPLPSFLGGEIVTGFVRGGVPTTIGCWVDQAVGTALEVTYPGGATTVSGLSIGQHSATFTPAADGVVSIEVQNFAVSGLTLSEGAAPVTWVPGEEMPCMVAVDEPTDTLLMHHTGAWRHEYGFTIREVD